jgi:hypothetical protein
MISDMTFCAEPLEPFTCAVKVVLLDEFGVPWSTPPDDSDSPPGSDPTVDHVHVPVQPVTASAWL